jgi:hypothetical protein
MFAAIARHISLIEIRLGQAKEISMKQFVKILAALAFGASAFGVTTAFAEHRESRYDSRSDYGRPEHCDLDHDHRSHAENYYNYYPADRYSRAGDYRSSGVSLSVRIGDRGDRGYRNDRHRHRGDDYDNEYGYGDRYRERRPVHREVYDTRYRARIALVEEVVRTRHGQHVVCTVSARGPDAHHVPYGRLRSIAARECSSHARIRIDA